MLLNTGPRRTTKGGGRSARSAASHLAGWAEAREPRGCQGAAMLFIRLRQVAESRDPAAARCEGLACRDFRKLGRAPGTRLTPRTASSPPCRPPAPDTPRAPEGCLPVCGTAAGAARRGQERARLQPGAPRQVAGGAPPPGSAAHLRGQRRLPGGRPARGALPILKGSGHRGRSGGSGVLGDPRPGEGGSGAGGEVPVRRPSARQVRWPRRLRSGPGGSAAPPSSGRGVGGGQGAEEEGGERGGAVGGGRGRRGDARRGRGGSPVPVGPRAGRGRPGRLASFPSQARPGFGGCAPGLGRRLPRWAPEREDEPGVRVGPAPLEAGTAERRSRPACLRACRWAACELRGPPARSILLALQSEIIA